MKQVTTTFETAHLVADDGYPLCGARTVYTWEPLERIPDPIIPKGSMAQCQRCLRIATRR